MRVQGRLIICRLLVRSGLSRLLYTFSAAQLVPPTPTKVVDLYRQQTHNQVSLVFDPSPAVKKRIEDGEAADVAIVQPDFAEALTKSGKVSAGDRPIIGHVGVGLGNRVDSPA